jgi:branched-subunit amino acid aminotransferase/4-amino-4-deoxychorismate lyase
MSGSKTASSQGGERRSGTTALGTRTMTLAWRDGILLDSADPAKPPHDAVNAAREEPYCYTTLRVAAGRGRHLREHAARLARDAHALGLGNVDAELVEDACTQLGRTAFGDGSGVVRIEALPTDGTDACLYATTRAIGNEPATWSAITATEPHPGPSAFPGAKLTRQAFLDRAREATLLAEANEALLFNDQGLLVEGSRANILVVDGEGTLKAPSLELGAVAGVALEIVRRSWPDIVFAAIRRQELFEANEVIAINALRGARPITQLDDRAVGAFDANTWATRIDELLSTAP